VLESMVDVNEISAWRSLVVLGANRALISEVVHALDPRRTAQRFMLEGDVFPYIVYGRGKSHVLLSFWWGRPYSDRMKEFALTHGDYRILISERRERSARSKAGQFCLSSPWNVSEVGAPMPFEWIVMPPLVAAHLLASIESRIAGWLELEPGQRIFDQAIAMSFAETPIAARLAKILDA
jgi:hypothetical protein